MRRNRRAGAARAEQKKLKRRHIWVVPVGFLLILMLWETIMLRNFTDADKAEGYAYLLYSMIVMNAVFIPVMLAIVASRLCDMEIKGSTLKLLYTLETPGRFYDIKFLFEMKYLLLFTAGETAAILLLGKIYGFTERARLDIFLLHFIVITAIGAVLLGIQHLLSLLSENQIVPLLVGIGGAFLGLFSMFFPMEVNRLVIWGYFSVFTVAAVDWIRTSDTMYLYYTDFQYLYFAGFLAVGIIAYLLERWLFLRKEV